MKKDVEAAIKKYFPKNSKSSMDKIVKLSNTYPPVVSCKPFVLTPRLMGVMERIAAALVSRSPILVCGNIGVGKSLCVRATAWLCGIGDMKYCCLTPELEPTALVGQILPDSRTGQVNWVDGIITDSIRHDTWVLLDNVNQADSSCLERLNPVLEDPAQWVLTENGETVALEIDENFRILATANIGDGASTGELSPAFYNRFSNIFMSEFEKSEIDFLVHGLLGTREGSVVQPIIKLCCRIYSILIEDRKLFGIRTISRMLDSAYLLACSADDTVQSPLLQSVVLAAKACIVSQCKSENLKKKLSQAIEEEISPVVITISQNLLELRSSTGNEYVMTDTREGYARSVLCFIKCGFPVLLEVNFARLIV